MNLHDDQSETLASVLDDLRELARQYPALTSGMVRLLRAACDMLTFAAEKYLMK